MSVKRIIEIIFLILFWSIYIKSSGAQVSIAQITAYFLIAMGVADLTMARWGSLSSVIGNQVKSGQISNYMIKPVKLIPTLYAIAQGRNGLRLMLAVLNILASFLIMPPRSFLSFGFFILFFINACAISFAFDLFQGTLYLHFTDASGIRNSIQNFTRIFTGSMVPLYLFPSPLKEILHFSPFPSMVYLPAYSLSSSFLLSSAVQDVFIGIFWSVAMNLFVLSFWNYSMKKYEAVGI